MLSCNGVPEPVQLTFIAARVGSGYVVQGAPKQRPHKKAVLTLQHVATKATVATREGPGASVLEECLVLETDTESVLGSSENAFGLQLGHESLPFFEPHEWQPQNFLLGHLFSDVHEEPRPTGELTAVRDAPHPEVVEQLLIAREYAV